MLATCFLVFTTDLYKYSPDAVPPIHVVSYHVATDKPPAQNGGKFRSIFSDNLQPLTTRGKKARGTLLVDQHCGNGCSIKPAPLCHYEISGGHIGRAVVRRKCSAGPVLPCGLHSLRRHSLYLLITNKTIPAFQYITIERVSYLIYVCMRHYVLTTSGDIIVCFHTAVCLSC